MSKKHDDEPPRVRSNPTRIVGIVLYVGGMLAGAAFFWNRWQTYGIHELHISKCHTIPSEPTLVILLALGALYFFIEALQGWHTGVERLPVWKYVVVLGAFGAGLMLLNRGC